MPKTGQIEKQIFQLSSPAEFNGLSLKIFHFQYENNPVYRKFVDFLKPDLNRIRHFSQIPFLPIELFKKHRILSGGFQSEVVFTSSGTSSTQCSRHYVAKTALYTESFSRGFESFFGQPSGFVILALLPSYLERGGSSLVFMAQKLIESSRQAESGFYLHEYGKLADLLKKLRDKKKKVMLLGVTYALLDLAEQFPLSFPELYLVETGGMKGRRTEIIREELHETLAGSFGTSRVYSEYGMTELLSQAWSKGLGIFETPAWMKVLIRDMNDPLSLLPHGKTGGINIIDLANLYSCSFIATGDLGKLLPLKSGQPAEQFTVLGRFDNSDVRGCNLMVI
ncbi:MAG: acyltransferase [Bacteroidales bacterium]|nr:acyltransferase [Bacteroidales bacterium]